jgi:hypothetical protein
MRLGIIGLVELIGGPNDGALVQWMGAGGGATVLITVIPPRLKPEDGIAKVVEGATCGPPPYARYRLRLDCAHADYAGMHVEG